MATQHAPTQSWLDTRLPLRAVWRATVSDHRSAREQPYLATLPGLILGALVFLAASGAVLSLFYVAAEGRAYDSIQFITRSVNFGWLIRAFHATGTTMLFGAVYLLLFRTLLTRGYKGVYDLSWFLKLSLFILLLLTGWLGFVMADGAMSYWSLHNAALGGARLGGFPGAIAAWIFGGPAGPDTLARMAVFHVVLALLLLAVAGGLIAANRVAASVPARRSVAFHPYYTSQYFAAFVIFALIFAVLIFFAPHIGEDRLNLLPGNPLIVPAHLVLPWYLLPVAGIDSTLPGPGGILAVIAALAVLYALPWLDRSAPGMPASLAHKGFVWLLALDVIALGLVTAAPASALTPILTGIFILWYFLHFLVITPLVTGAL